MPVDDRENAGTHDATRSPHAEQAVIPQTGDAGVVETHGGATSLGTTPIGLGSVGPLQQHQQATDMIMGQTDAAEAAPTATAPGNGDVPAQGTVQRAVGQDPERQASQPAARPVRITPPASTSSRTIPLEVVFAVVALLAGTITWYLIRRRRTNQSVGSRILARARRSLTSVIR